MQGHRCVGLCEDGWFGRIAREGALPRRLKGICRDAAQLVTCLWPWWKKQSSQQGKKNDTKHGICSFGLAKRLTSVLSQQTRWPFWPSRSSIRCTCDKFEHLKTLLYKFVSTFVRPLEATLHYIHSFILISVIKPISIIVDWFSTCQQWYILKPTRWRNGTVIIYKPDLCQHFSSVTNVLLIFVLNRILYCGRLSAWSAIKFLTLCCLTGYYYTII